MDAEAIHARLRDACGSGVGALVEGRCEPYLEVGAAAIVSVCRTARDDDELAFEHLSNLTAVDDLERNLIRVVYHLHSYARAHWLTLKVSVDRERPQVPSVEAVYPIANWLEREAYDLVGVTFEGHTDLRRILMPEDWEGHPLRKDFREPSHYHGISTARESMLTIPRDRQ